jgi:hypothetical protein
MWFLQTIAVAWCTSAWEPYTTPTDASFYVVIYTSVFRLVYYLAQWCTIFIGTIIVGLQFLLTISIANDVHNIYLFTIDLYKYARSTIKHYLAI